MITLSPSHAHTLTAHINGSVTTQVAKVLTGSSSRNSYPNLEVQGGRLTSFLKFILHIKDHKARFNAVELWLNGCSYS